MQMAAGVKQQQQHQQLQSTHAQKAVNRVVLPFVLLVTVFNYISRTNLEYGEHR
jgi:ABC-type polysaccharide transport system permease subunit